jgi:hypothetical protein
MNQHRFVSSPAIRSLRTTILTFFAALAAFFDLVIATLLPLSKISDVVDGAIQNEWIHLVRKQSIRRGRIDSHRDDSSARRSEQRRWRQSVASRRHGLEAAGAESTSNLRDTMWIPTLPCRYDELALRKRRVITLLNRFGCSAGRFERTCRRGSVVRPSRSASRVHQRWGIERT